MVSTDACEVQRLSKSEKLWAASPTSRSSVSWQLENIEWKTTAQTGVQVEGGAPSRQELSSAQQASLTAKSCSSMVSK